MNSLDRMIKSERKQKYKRLRKLRQARDMASKHAKHKLLLSKVFKFVKRDNVDECLFKSNLAKHILDNQFRITLQAPRPPKTSTK